MVAGKLISSSRLSRTLLTFSPSRQAIKKYVRANNNVDAAAAGFDRFFNEAITKGVKAGEFEQPKGMHLCYEVFRSC